MRRRRRRGYQMPPYVYKVETFCCPTHPQNTSFLRNTEVDFHKGQIWLKCRVCQPDITYLETMNQPEVSFSALTNCSVDHDVGSSSMKRKRETNMILNHCQALSKPITLTKL
jgi:hypothetical protein